METPKKRRNIPAVPGIRVFVHCQQRTDGNRTRARPGSAIFDLTDLKVARRVIPACVTGRDDCGVDSCQFALSILAAARDLVRNVRQPWLIGERNDAVFRTAMSGAGVFGILR
jgi:hypothetical protein